MGMCDSLFLSESDSRPSTAERPGKQQEVFGNNEGDVLLTVDVFLFLVG
jgi:hypothetical protein